MFLVFIALLQDIQIIFYKDVKVSFHRLPSEKEQLLRRMAWPIGRITPD